MKRYTAHFIGRATGAIGIRHNVNLTVEAEDIEAAKLKLYDTHEHISHLVILPEGTKLQAQATPE